MAVIKLDDGSEPPFGAVVMNARKQQTGLVNDGGNVYLSGINAGDTMTVHWSGEAQCEVQMPLPLPLPEDMLMNMLLLPCHPVNAEKPDSDKSTVPVPQSNSDTNFTA
ncbi:FimD/PapC C-terminal domain-containing protein [Pseudomonas cerasi]